MAHVLVVDDDDPTRAALHDALEDAGHAVAEARDGKAALATLQDSQLRWVVLLDYRMPVQDAVGFLRAVSAHPTLHSRHCYILMTVFRPAELVLPEEVRRLLAFPVIYKPYILDQLLRVVAEADRMLTTA